MIVIFVTCQTKETELFRQLKLPKQGEKLLMGLANKKGDADSRNKVLRGGWCQVLAYLNVQQNLLKQLMSLKKGDSFESSIESIPSKRHNRTQSTQLSRPRGDSVKAIRENYLQQYNDFKESLDYKTKAKMMKLDFIIRNTKEISDILKLDLPALGTKPSGKSKRATQFKIHTRR